MPSEKPPGAARGAQRELMQRAWREEACGCRLLLLSFFLRTLSVIGAAWVVGLMLATALGFASHFQGDEWFGAFAWVAGLLVVRMLCTVFEEQLAHGLAARMRHRWQSEVLALRPQGAMECETALTLLGDGSGRIEQFYRTYLPASLQLGVVPLVLVVAVFFLDWPSGLVLLFCGPLIPIFMVLIGLLTKDHIEKQWGMMLRLQKRFARILYSFEDLQVLGADTAQAAGVPEASRRFRELTMKVLALAFLSGFVLEFFAMLSTALVAVQLGVRLVEGWIGFAVAWTVLLLTPEFFLPFRQLGAAHHSGMEGAESADEILKGQALKAEEDHRRSHASLPSYGANHVPSRTPGKGLEVENLSFRYGSDYPELFSGLSFALPSTGFVSVSGPSGCGKSTLMRLLLGFLKPEAGWMSWQGDMRAENDTWKQRFAWTPQWPHFFPGSIFSNLTLTGHQSEAVCWEALRAVDLEEVIARRGLHGWLPESARDLSEGQRHRLAVARALVSERPIHIWDEPASALDVASEAVLTNTMRRIAEDHLLVVVAHRQRTVAAAQTRIRYLDGGWQVEGVAG
ncbi:MAG: ABC transporter ATP-binding protein/permease [Verrucomicrobiales bacterium]